MVFLLPNLGVINTIAVKSLVRASSLMAGGFLLPSHLETYIE
jgi:hypothetical protein